MRLRAAFLAALLCLSACAQAPYVVQHSAEAQPLRNNTVYIDDHGWHTGFILPAAPLNADLPFLTQRFGQTAPYYELGWGDKGFYQSHEVTTGLTLRAMFWSSGSVLHIVAVPTQPAEYFPNSTLIPVKLSDSEFRDLRRFIRGSFAYDAKGNAIALQTGLYGDSQFYEGKGSYYILNTCNKWTAKGLKSSGMDINPALKLTAGSVMGYLQDRANPQKTQTPPANYRILH